MKELVDCLQSLSRLLTDICLISPVALRGIPLAPQFNYDQWRNDPFNHDAGAYLNVLLSKAPTFDFQQFVSSEVEYLHEGHVALGLAAAHDQGSLAVSTPGAESFKKDNLPLEVIEMSGTDAGDILVSERIVQVMHGWGPNLDAHSEWIDEQKRLRELAARAALLSAEDVASQCGSVEILPAALAQLKSLEGDRLRRAAETLLLLDSSVHEWARAGSVAPVWRTKVTPESDSRINKGIVQFTDNDGRKFDFSLHARFTPGAGRIHFRLINETKRIRVAYIGSKLN